MTELHYFRHMGITAYNGDEVVWGDPVNYMVYHIRLSEPSESYYITFENQRDAEANIAELLNDTTAKYEVEGELMYYEKCDHCGKWTYHEDLYATFPPAPASKYPMLVYCEPCYLKHG